MTKIALAVLLSIGLTGFTAAKEPHARTAMAAKGTEPRLAITAIKAIVNQSRFTVEVRNTENPRQERNGANVPPILTPGAPRVHPVEMWIPWVRTSPDFRTHHISVILKDGSRLVRRFAIWQHADFDGDWVRVGEFHDASETTEIVYTEPGTHIRGASAVGGDRVLEISVNGDLSLGGFR